MPSDPIRLLPDTALLVIDLQHAIDAPYHAIVGPRNNPSAEQVVATLLASWRSSGRPIIHIRHDSIFSDSAYRPGQPGNDFKPEAAPLPGETVIGKRTNNAFIDTGLEQHLR
ncbi:MAG: isochorismatase family protein, partial [Ferrovibrio sp.]